MVDAQEQPLRARNYPIFGRLDRGVALPVHRAAQGIAVRRGVPEAWPETGFAPACPNTPKDGDVTVAGARHSRVLRASLPRASLEIFFIVLPHIGLANPSGRYYAHCLLTPEPRTTGMTTLPVV